MCKLNACLSFRYWGHDCDSMHCLTKLTTKSRLFTAFSGACPGDHALHPSEKHWCWSEGSCLAASVTWQHLKLSMPAMLVTSQFQLSFAFPLSPPLSTACQCDGVLGEGSLLGWRQEHCLGAGWLVDLQVLPGLPTYIDHAKQMLISAYILWVELLLLLGKSNVCIFQRRLCVAFSFRWRDNELFPSKPLHFRNREAKATDGNALVFHCKNNSSHKETDRYTVHTLLLYHYMMSSCQMYKN